MRIREATVADAAHVAEVHVRSWQVAYRGLVPQDYLDGLDPAARRERWSALLADDRWPRAGTLVAELDDRIVGFASILPARDADLDPAAFGEIAAFYLDPGVWRRGIGRRLMAAALDRLAAAGYPRAALWVLDTNLRARRFYEATGWRCDGTVKVDESLGFPITETRYRRELGDLGPDDAGRPENLPRRPPPPAPPPPPAAGPGRGRSGPRP